MHSADSWIWPPMTATSTSRAAAATAALDDVPPVAWTSYAYGRERRRTAFTASWTAMCTIAYMRASAIALPSGPRHAASAALPAFSFHLRTASVRAALGDAASTT